MCPLPVSDWALGPEEAIPKYPCLALILDCLKQWLYAIVAPGPARVPAREHHGEAEKGGTGGARAGGRGNPCQLRSQGDYHEVWATGRRDDSCHEMK